VELYFLPPGDLVLACSFDELLEKHLHQVDPEYQLIDLLSGGINAF
jgi:hypothetical protein